MTFDGLLVEGSRDAGSCLLNYFAIPPGQESVAGRELLACLAEGAEVSLSNDLDEGGEGCSCFRRLPSGLVMKIGGHGWQSDWKPIDEAGFLAAVAELAGHNRGGPSAHGSISQAKSSALGPFDSPVNYTFEPELLRPVPRSIPATRRVGRFARRWMWTAVALLALGGATLFIAKQDISLRLGEIVLAPDSLTRYAEYLIGYGALGILCSLLDRLAPDRSRYIRHGLPLVARVLNVVKGPSVFASGKPWRYVFTALIELRDPQTNELQLHWVKSPSFAARHKDDWTPPFKSGDYVTALYLPKNYPKSLQLFDFLELEPALGLVHRARQQRKTGEPPLQ